MRDPSRIRSETYRYAAGTHEHPRGLFRSSHRRRFALAVRLLEADHRCRVLDYGSGDGYLLGLLLRSVPAEQMIALEPLQFLQAQFRERYGTTGILLATSAAELPAGGFDRIACLEVLEHLRPEAVERTLDDLERLLTPGGVLVVSVPIEVGPSVLIKYAAARLLTKMDRWYTPREVFRSSLGLPVARDAEGSFLSHRGYDHRITRRQLRRRFRIERETYSPVPWARGALNAQVFWKLTAQRHGR